MTDEQKIIKALECCIDYDIVCEGCPLIEYTLDLINRQKTEIERLKERNDELNALNKIASIEAIKEFWRRLKKSIEKSIEDAWHADGNGIYEADCVLNYGEELVKEMVGDSDA